MKLLGSSITVPVQDQTSNHGRNHLSRTHLCKEITWQRHTSLRSPVSAAVVGRVSGSLSSTPWSPSPDSPASKMRLQFCQEHGITKWESTWSGYKSIQAQPCIQEERKGSQLCIFVLMRMGRKTNIRIFYPFKIYYNWEIDWSSVVAAAFLQEGWHNGLSFPWHIHGLLLQKWWSANSQSQLDRCSKNLICHTVTQLKTELVLAT